MYFCKNGNGDDILFRLWKMFNKLIAILDAKIKKKSTIVLQQLVWLLLTLSS